MGAKELQGSMRVTAIMLCIASHASAQDFAPVMSEKPVPRPDRGAFAASVPANFAKSETAGRERITEPPTEVDDPDPAPPGIRDQMRLDDDEYAACLAALDEMGVTYREADRIAPEDDRDCGILRPVIITEIAPGVEILPEATLRCPAARALASWTQDFVLPSVERLESHRELEAIESGAGYNCRLRNNRADGKISEHAFGNAFDVMGFRFAEGTPLPIQRREGDGTLEEAFQAAVRAAACLDFSTVLGPGSSAEHDDHLHFDIIAR